jgi:hypothetical protein
MCSKLKADTFLLLHLKMKMRRQKVEEAEKIISMRNPLQQLFLIIQTDLPSLSIIFGVPALMC